MGNESGNFTAGTSFDDVLRLYRALLRETGGESGFLSEGTLRYILHSLNSVRGDVFSKAAFVIHEIATKHPMINGNKRLAFALGALVLRKGGYVLSLESSEAVTLMLRVAREEVPKRDLEAWLRNKCKKI